MARTEEPGFPAISVEYVPTELAQMYSVLASSSDGSASGPILKALALARRLQNPEAMVAEVFSRPENIRSLQMHALQRFVRADRLERAVTNEIITAVNRSCLSIFAVLDHVHLEPSLQYICGLGPRKAKAMLSIFREEREIVNRQMLVRPGVLGPCVAYNMVGFIIVDSESSEDNVANPLDTTRIHPESYKPAIKVALDALEVDDASQSKGGDLNEAELQAVRDIFQHNARLNGLILERFAEQLRTEVGYGDKLQTLRDICAEFRHPVEDNRHEYRQLIDASRQLTDARDNVDEVARNIVDEVARNIADEVAHRLFVCLTGVRVPSPLRVPVVTEHNRGELRFHEPIESDISLWPTQIVEVSAEAHAGSHDLWVEEGR
jgi:transcription elongation factor SPT6